MLINFVRGAKCHDDMRRLNGVLYPSYRYACYSLSLLEDDKEYIDDIIEANSWGSVQTIKKLFANLLVAKSTSRSEFVWESCWRCMSDDILYNKRRESGNQSTTFIFDK